MPTVVYQFSILVLKQLPTANSLNLYSLRLTVVNLFFIRAFPSLNDILSQMTAVSPAYDLGSGIVFQHT